MHNSRPFYPEAARHDVAVLDLRVDHLLRTLRQIEILNPPPAITALIEDAREYDERTKWQ